MITDAEKTGYKYHMVFWIWITSLRTDYRDIYEKVNSSEVQVESL